MKTVVQLLAQLHSRGVKIWAEGERLRYKAPKGAMSPTLRAELKRRKAEVLEFLHLAEQPQSESAIKAMPRPDKLPLSSSQQRLWFLSQLEGANVAYNMPSAFKISGPLNLAALEQSLTEIVQRHEIMRTTISVAEGQPWQVSHPPQPVTLEVENLQHLTGQSQQEAVKERLKREVHTPFDLQTGPLWRAYLLQQAGEHYVFVLNMHHIISDGWSMGIFMRELLTLYDAFLQNKPSPLPPLAIQYADFALWQDAWFDSEAYQEQLNYWTEQLTDAPHFNLPTDHVRPAVESFQGGRYRLSIAGGLLAQLNLLSKNSDSSLFMTLLAAFKVLLYRYSGQADIVLGTSIANRNRHEIEGLIGFFINTLVMRTTLSGDLTFQRFLQQVRQVALAGMQNQDVPFDKVVEAVQPERSAGANPLVQVMFILQNLASAELKHPDLSLTSLEMPFNMAKLDLSLTIGEGKDTLEIALAYNSDLFERSTIERMAGHYQTLLTAIVSNPAQRVADLPILTAAEEEAVLFECNSLPPFDKLRDRPLSLSKGAGHYLQHVFEEQVSKSPDAVALVLAQPGQIKVIEEQLTYQALNERANQLAHYLIRQGVGRDTLVGLCVERSLYVVGVLGILKAGGAYVPLDPTYPQGRLAFMLEDAQLSILLTQAHLEANLPEHQAMTIKLDTDWELISRCSTRNPVLPMVPTQLAYVIYTSGSTGKPKGVLVSHKGLVNLALSQIDLFGVSLMSRVLQFASFSFDAAISEIAMALCSGASLYVAQKESLLPGPPLEQLLQQHQISHITLPPSALAVMNPQGLPALQSLIVAGEASTTELLKSWAKGRRVFNAYGPSENTVCATMMDCSQPGQISSSSPPIGRAINNVQVYILDHHLNPLPIGVPGELHIGGLGIARGYLNRPQLTASKFIPNPFSAKPGERLYKTGDLARYILSETGLNIEFLGRIDHQVKIRGFRIELGEIEAVLSQHPQVRDVLVIVRQNQDQDKDKVQSSADKQLVAYIIPEEEHVPRAAISDFAQHRLPDYMVPSAYVTLQAFPLTPNGKIDRRKLPAPGADSLEREAFVPPRSPTEERLVTLWREVLNIDSISVIDNFFALGGHSLLAIKLMAAVEEQFNKNLQPAVLFQRPTIADLAQAIVEASDHDRWGPIATIQAGDESRPPLFCAPAATPSVFYLHIFARYLGTDQPFYGLQPPGFDGVTEPMPTVEDLAIYFVDAIQEIQPEGPYLVAGHSAGGPTAIEIGLQLEEQGETVFLFSLDTMPYFPDIQQGSDGWVAEKNLKKYVRGWKYLWEDKTDFQSKDLEELQGEALLEQAGHLLKLAGLLPPEADIEIVRRISEITSASMLPLLDYRPQSDFQGQAVIIQAKDSLSDEAQNSMLKEQSEMVSRWQSVCDNPVQRYLVPGDHASMMIEPHILSWTGHLRAHIDQIISDHYLDFTDKIMSDTDKSSVASSDFPITWADPADAELLWGRDTSRGYDPLTPLDFDLRIQTLTNASNTIGRIQGMPFVSRVQLFNGYAFGSVTFLDDDLTVRSRQMQIVTEQTREAMLNLETLWRDHYLPEIKGHLAYWQTYDLSRATWPALLEHLTETQKRAERLWEIHALVLMPVMYAMSEFEETYKALFSSEDDEEQPFAAYNLLSGLENKSVAAGRWLWQLSRQALASPVVKQLLQDTEAAQVKETLQLHSEANDTLPSEGRAFWADVQAYLSEHGHGNDSLYLNQPSLLEDPTPLFSNLQSYISQPEKDSSAQMKATELREQALAAARTTLEGYPTVMATEFEQLLKAAQVGTVLSEDHNHWIDTQAYYYPRQVCLAVGRALVEKGMIEQAEDVFFLSLKELQALKGNLPTEGLQTMISQRQNDLKRFATYTPPATIGSIQSMPAPENDPLAENSLLQALRKFENFAPQQAEKPDQLKGYGGSSGKATGPAKVALTLAELDKIQPGDILVAPVTLPSWTPIFATVSAIVTDIGGILSHSAVVAREYGIPAVVGTRIGTTTITDGQMIEVDGDRGVVQLVLSS